MGEDEVKGVADQFVWSEFVGVVDFHTWNADY